MNRNKKPKQTIDDVAKAHAEGHAADTREMDRLEAEIKMLRNTSKNLTTMLEEKDSEIELWRTAYNGLEARIKIFEIRDKERNKKTLGPLMQGIGGGLIGAALYGIGSSMVRDTKARRNGPGDYDVNLGAKSDAR